MENKRTTFLKIGAIAIVLIAGACIYWSGRTPVPITVHKVTSDGGLYGGMVALQDGRLILADFRKLMSMNPDGEIENLFRWIPTNGIRTSGPGVKLAGNDLFLLRGRDWSTQKNQLVAVRDGAVEWGRLHNGFINSQPLVHDDFMVLRNGTNLLGLDFFGKEIWSAVPQLGSVQGYGITPQGQTIYNEGDQTNHWMVKLDSDGNELWRRPTTAHRWPPVFADDGTIYWDGWFDATLSAFSPDGQKLWTLKEPDVALSSPAIGKDGIIYLTSHTNLIAVNIEGELSWIFPLKHSTPRVSPVIGTDGTIYHVTGDRWVRAINPDGTLKWRHRVPGKLTLNFGSSWASFTKQFKRGFTTKLTLHGPPILTTNGILYVNFADTGSVYAFHVGDHPGD